MHMHNCSLEAKIKRNLNSHVVEQAAEVKKPERKKPNSKEPTAKRAKVGKGKKFKDSNAAKRSPTDFFVFMDEFRKFFKEANLDSKDVKRIGKEDSEKWRSLTEEEKKPFSDKVYELMAEYEKAMELFRRRSLLYNTTTAENEDQEGSDKEGQSDDKEAPTPGEVEELTDEE